MGAIYIQGLEMPEAGSDQILRITPDGTVYDHRGIRLDACAVSVPEHGELIDRDAMIENGLYIIGPNKKAYLSVQQINEAPVVIPRDKERRKWQTSEE